MNAFIFAAIFAVRWLMQIRDHLIKVGGSKINLHEGTVRRLLQIFSARLVLEVWGGGGAIWGFRYVKGWIGEWYERFRVLTPVGTFYLP